MTLALKGYYLFVKFSGSASKNIKEPYAALEPLTADPRFIENTLSGSLNCGSVFDGSRISNKFWILVKTFNSDWQIAGWKSFNHSFLVYKQKKIFYVSDQVEIGYFRLSMLSDELNFKKKTQKYNTYFVTYSSITIIFVIVHSLSEVSTLAEECIDFQKPA